MIIHNQIHELLVDIGEKQGWNEESQIMHLCGFIQRSVDDPEWTSNSDLHFRYFRKYLQAVANEENNQEGETMTTEAKEKPFEDQLKDACSDVQNCILRVKNTRENCELFAVKLASATESNDDAEACYLIARQKLDEVVNITRITPIIPTSQ